MRNKKILYGISNFGGDMGGHLRSLKAILQEMMQYNQAVIHVVLFSLKPVKEGTYSFPCEKFHIISSPEKGLNGVVQTRRATKQLLQNENFDLIHCFDSNAYFFLRPLSNAGKIPMLLTKCGGPPAPKWKYPACKDITLFSVEDEVNFSRQSRFRKTTLHLIPNRVKPPVQDEALIQALKQKHNGGFNFLRISRFTKLHEHSLMQSIELIRYLEAHGIRMRLLILGGIEDREVYDRVQQAIGAGNLVVLETEERFCKDASKIIDVAEFVIGSGRGLMEAAALGKVLLAPNKNLRLPVLVEENSFPQLFHHNFSGRTTFNDTYAALNEQHLLELSNGAGKEKFSKFSSDMFARHFDIKNGIPRYLALYEATPYKKQNDLIGNLAQTLVISRHFIKKRNT